MEATHHLHFAFEYMAKICGTLVVIYKFFFPFLSASYVTLHESTLAQALNDKVDFLGVAIKTRDFLDYSFLCYNGVFPFCVSCWWYVWPMSRTSKCISFC